MHSNHTPTLSMSKVGSNKSIPLVENFPRELSPWESSTTPAVNLV